MRALLTNKVVDRTAVIVRALVPAPGDLTDRVEGFDGDVTDDTGIHAVVETITPKFGPHPDVLCNNAGGGESGWFESGRDGEWHSVGRRDEQQSDLCGAARTRQRRHAHSRSARGHKRSTICP
jgi:NAD(P)-dependent dehydrogenase (short-subunit alcohol dehydrogenase family)